MGLESPPHTVAFKQYSRDHVRHRRQARELADPGLASHVDHASRLRLEPILPTLLRQFPGPMSPLGMRVPAGVLSRYSSGPTPPSPFLG